MKGMINIEFKKIEEGIIPIYENESKERLINARELHRALECNTKFADWIKRRIKHYEFIENREYICFLNFEKAEKYGNKTTREYYLTIDMAKELCMVENNVIAKNIRHYFIDIENRYRQIAANAHNLLDFIEISLNQIENNSKNISILKSDIDELKSKIDIRIQNNYCLASDIAEQLNLYSENKIPHSNLIGAIARELGYKVSYKHYYEDEYIAIIKDISKNEYWQVYFKPKAVKKIIEWFNKNKEEIYYEIQYIKNTKNGKKGEVKEKGYKIENISYKIQPLIKEELERTSK